MLTASCYSSQYCFTFFCSFTWALPNPSVVRMHCQLPCIAKHVLYSCLRTLKYRMFAYARILHKYNTDVTDPQSFMPASAWHSCRDAALFPNYFGQTCCAFFLTVPFLLPSPRRLDSQQLFTSIIFCNLDLQQIKFLEFL